MKIWSILYRDVEPKGRGVANRICANVESANALLVSIKADQAITFSIVQSIEAVMNRYIQAQSFGKTFRIEFLDVSPYNEKEISDEYLKGCQYGAPMISRYCSSIGVKQDELETMNYLEVDVLQLPDKFKPLVNSAQVSTTSTDTDNAGGRPRKDDTELTDSGAQSREDGVEDGDWG